MAGNAEISGGMAEDTSKANKKTGDVAARTESVVTWEEEQLGQGFIQKFCFILENCDLIWSVSYASKVLVWSQEK